MAWRVTRRKKSKEEKKKTKVRGKRGRKSRGRVITLAPSLVQGGSSQRCHSSQTLSWSSSLFCIVAVIFSITSTSLTLAYRAYREGGERLFQLRVTRQRAAIRMCRSSFYRDWLFLMERGPSKRISVSWISTPQRPVSVVVALNAKMELLEGKSNRCGKGCLYPPGNASSGQSQRGR